MDKRETKVLVVGTGAAGLNAAHELLGHHIQPLLLSDNPGGGTSFDAGSDKQTYYKLGLSAGTGDSIDALASAFYAGGMHGDTARILATMSAQGFYKLVALGVPFPHNEFGEYVGYRTDHDNGSMRATSAGPLTSRYMGQALWKAVEGRVEVLCGRLVSLYAQGESVGALWYDGQQFHCVAANAILLATGGAATVYADTVYPTAQPSGIGAALRAGAVAANLCHWQYGIASLKPRWNLSGSYQQVLPRYLSVGDDGAYEFLQNTFPDTAQRMKAVFLKGYEWPFDARKTQNGGSSLIDLAVHGEMQKGRRVFLDYSQNPQGYDQDMLPDIVQSYLKESKALGKTPFERLQAMNPDAVALYRSHGIDLKTAFLEVAVCAQHINGGLAVDWHWRTSLQGIYAAGETAGCFGCYRPGGSALNETQVGSARAAAHIARYVDKTADSEIIWQWAEQESQWLRGHAGNGEDMTLAADFSRQMSKYAAHLRTKSGRVALAAQLATPWQARKGNDIAGFLELRDRVTVQAAMLSAMDAWEGKAGGLCWGGAVYGMPQGNEKTNTTPPEGIIETCQTDDGWHSEWVERRPLPEGGGWFEDVWRQFRERK